MNKLIIRLVGPDRRQEKAAKSVQEYLNAAKTVRCYNKLKKIDAKMMNNKKNGGGGSNNGSNK